jgi:ZIP family zinc transporter
VERIGGRAGRGAAGMRLLLGALLDGIPEQAVLGIGLAAGEGVSVALLVAIFVSNLPESIGSATDMRSAGTKSRTIILGWIIVATVCALATVGGYGISALVGDLVDSSADHYVKRTRGRVRRGPSIRKPARIKQCRDRLEDQCALSNPLSLP